MNTSEYTSDSPLDTLSIAAALVSLEKRQLLRAEGFDRRTLAALAAADAGEPINPRRIDQLRERGWIEAGASGITLTALGAETLDRATAAIAGLEARVTEAMTSPEALTALVAELGGIERVNTARAERAGCRGRSGRGFGREFGPGEGRGFRPGPDGGRGLGRGKGRGFRPGPDAARAFGRGEGRGFGREFGPDLASGDEARFEPGFGRGFDRGHGRGNAHAHVHGAHAHFHSQHPMHAGGTCRPCAHAAHHAW